MSDGTGLPQQDNLPADALLRSEYTAPMISLILTVRNERASLPALLASLLAQTRPPDEIVIVDGGSQDDSVALLQGYSERLPLRLLIEPGCNISRGRNLAIRAARGDLIAVTDAGVRLAPDWLQQLTEPLLADAQAQAVAGFFCADPQSTFELALGATTLPLRNEIDARHFLPSSRSVAFRKSAWQAIGGYPEWLDHCEDLVFDLRLRQRCGPFVFAPGALAHFRPRPSLPAFFRQYYSYARGDGLAGLWTRRHLIRYGTYLVALPLLLIAGWQLHPLWWLIGLLAGLVYLARPLQRLWTLRQQGLSRERRSERGVWLLALPLLPLIRATGDLAKMLGWPAGLWLRRRRPPPRWR